MNLLQSIGRNVTGQLVAIFRGGVSALLPSVSFGSFSPFLSTNGTDFTTVSYATTPVGIYIKIDKLVFYSFRMTWNNTTGSPSGALKVAGFPFQVRSVGPAFQANAIGEYSTIDAPGAATNQALGLEFAPAQTFALVVANGENQSAQSVLAASNGGAVTRDIITNGFYISN